MSGRWLIAYSHGDVHGERAHARADPEFGDHRVGELNAVERQRPP
jgi:hypothetical protein